MNEAISGLHATCLKPLLYSHLYIKLHKVANLVTNGMIHN